MQKMQSLKFSPIDHSHEAWDIGRVVVPARAVRITGYEECQAGKDGRDELLRSKGLDPSKSVESRRAWNMDVSWMWNAALLLCLLLPACGLFPLFDNVKAFDAEQNQQEFFNTLNQQQQFHTWATRKPS